MELTRLAELARQDAGRKFYSIAHLLTTEALWEAFDNLRKDAAAGVDGVTCAEYEEHLVENLGKLHEKLKSKTYRAQPLRRIYIDKEDGRKRPISIPSLEDKIVQRATVELLNAIFEQDFLDCSYGFRPGRSAHDALDEVGRVICRGPTEYVLELDISSYFDSIVRKQLMEMVERRVSDASILRLIGKWINIGVVDDGRLLTSETGTGQGQIISPLLANIYLHHVLDVWFEEEVKPRLRGKAFEIRYADDGLLCFQFKEDAERVLEVLPKRFAKYGLTLHPEKTRLVKFGRSAYYQAKRTKTKTATFDFLGFTHRCATSRAGKFAMHVSTMKKPPAARAACHRRVVSRTSAHAIGIPAADAQRETARPLPVLRPSDELSQSAEVRPRGPPHLASVAGSQAARKGPPLAALQSHPSALSLVAPAHHACLASFASRA
jgi:group II intron reverse transcriptase/maturase